MNLNGVTMAAGTSGAAGAADQAPSPKLVKAAQQFEAMMMKELLKPMTATDELSSEDGDSGDDAGSANALQEFASEALGEALSRSGGFGIADQIVRELSRSGNRSGSGKVTPNRHHNTVMNTIQ